MLPVDSALKKNLTLAPLVAATYFMVAGGPYGLEELVHHSGYQAAVVLLLLTPLLWSVPAALMVGELASAMPDEGGYYVWVKRALGPFWGFQEAWLSLCASVFDMAIYPTLFVLYLGRLWPAAAGGPAATAVGVGVVAVSAAMNLRGARAVGRAAEAMALLLLGPFVVFCVLAWLAPAPAPVAVPSVAGARGDFIGGLVVAMWNYMGWDNASTVAGEVERPQRTYPRAVLLALACVVLTYVLPVAVAARTGLSPSDWSTGAWVDAGRLVGGAPLAIAIVVGGMVCGLGMMDALVMSYSRVPMVMAQDGYLPAAFARTLASNGAPWVSLVVLSLAWSLAIGLGFERLIELDVILYGLALVLQFVALVVLRVREPTLPRPFKVPGGIVAAIVLGLGPTTLLGLALTREHQEQAGQGTAIALGLGLAAAGAALFPLAARLRGRPRAKS
jgi:amino acid transporter